MRKETVTMSFKELDRLQIIQGSVNRQHCVWVYLFVRLKGWCTGTEMKGLPVWFHVIAEASR